VYRVLIRHAPCVQNEYRDDDCREPALWNRPVVLWLPITLFDRERSVGASERQSRFAQSRPRLDEVAVGTIIGRFSSNET